ncbi:MAG: nucleotidyltransferase family protein [Paracoccaceae bacterium]
MSAAAILILAAGASSRMRGGDKVMEEVGGAPLLTVLAQRALAAGAEVFVALPALTHPRAAALDGLAVTPVPAAEAAMGMARSIAAGVAALPSDCSGVMLLPADMPELTDTDLRAVLDAFAKGLGRLPAQGCAADGTPGHPVVFPARCFAALSALQGDQGARSVLKGEADILHIPLPARHALTDLDTPEDWAAWRAKA